MGNRYAQGVDNQADHETGNEVQCEVCAFLTALDTVRVDSEPPDGLRNGIDEREATTDHDGVDADGIIKDVVHAVGQADEHEAQQCNHKRPLVGSEESFYFKHYLYCSTKRAGLLAECEVIPRCGWQLATEVITYKTKPIGKHQLRASETMSSPLSITRSRRECSTTTKISPRTKPNGSARAPRK